MTQQAGTVPATRGSEPVKVCGPALGPGDALLEYGLFGGVGC